MEAGLEQVILSPSRTERVVEAGLPPTAFFKSHS